MENFIPEEDYKKILESVPIPCVDIFIKKDNKILLVLRKNNPGKGEWWPVGGRILKNEKIEEAIKRKVREESGLEVSSFSNLGSYETIFDEGPFEEMKEGVHTINLCFLAEVEDSSKISLDKTVEEYKWFDKIEDYFPEYTKNLLKKINLFE